MSRGFVFSTWNQQTFWRHGGGLPCSRPWLPTRSCYDVWRWCLWPDSYKRASREYLNGASNKPPGRHQIQNAEGPELDPCAKQIYFRRDPKVDPLRIESGPSWRARFWSILSDVLKFCRLLCAQNVKREATYTNSIRGRTLELGRPVFASPIFLIF